MGLLDGKREGQGPGNPEFFALKNFKRKIRIRRDSVQRYECNFDENKKKYEIVLYFNYGQGNNTYTFTIPEHQEEEKDKIMTILDGLFNTKML